MNISCISCLDLAVKTRGCMMWEHRAIILLLLHSHVTGKVAVYNYNGHPKVASFKGYS